MAFHLLEIFTSPFLLSRIRTKNVEGYSTTTPHYNRAVRRQRLDTLLLQLRGMPRRINWADMIATTRTRKQLTFPWEGGETMTPPSPLPPSSVTTLLEDSGDDDDNDDCHIRPKSPEPTVGLCTKFVDTSQGFFSPVRRSMRIQQRRNTKL